MSLHALCSLVLLVGCSSDPHTAAVPSPHDGVVIPVPDSPCRIEVVKKEGTSPISGEISLYIYKDAAFTPYEPAPESAELVVGNRQKMTLEIDEDALVTPMGPVLFANKEIQWILREAVLTVELDGETKAIRLGR